MAAEPQLRMASCLSLAKSDSIVRCASLESKLRSLQIAGPSGEHRQHSLSLWLADSQESRVTVLSPIPAQLQI